MQSQLKTIQPQFKNTKEEGKKIQLSQKGCSLLQVLIQMFNCKRKDLQGGTLCLHCLKGF